MDRYTLILFTGPPSEPLLRTLTGRSPSNPLSAHYDPSRLIPPRTLARSGALIPITSLDPSDIPLFADFPAAVEKAREMNYKRSLSGQDTFKHLKVQYLEWKGHLKPVLGSLMGQELEVKWLEHGVDATCNEDNCPGFKKRMERLKGEMKERRQRAEARARAREEMLLIETDVSRAEDSEFTLVLSKETQRMLRRTFYSIHA